MSSRNRKIPMRKLSLLGLAAVLLAISACDRAPAAQLEDIANTPAPKLAEDLPPPSAAALTEENKQLIRDTFDSIQSIQYLLETEGQSPWVIKTEEVSISLAEFVFAKKNRELILALNQSDESVKDAEVLQSLVTGQLVVHYARSLGITVTPEEIREMIHMQRSALSEAESSAAAEGLVQSIMKERIRIAGGSAEDFWNSEDVYRSYEAALYDSKLIDQILADERLRGMDSYKELRAKLYADFRKKHPVRVPDLSQLGLS
ncbi:MULTISPECIES: hypothetical protein [Paenibacillus]|uniref:SurA N-terminal domain-containing protein n=1 Tax=Paenibacillus campinasensis TaxID=66347 RepID=A0A268EDQ0_9BACL|nr:MULTISPECIES: hypothetical protein [Paenibacillus]MUG66053.1 hypothetical protein [Paenibacillus campinasensis]PAD71237.1 hypothetical protein CHH67_25280 [Paenibacillus campinasensis]PAK47362.1 hypothetical protein CHH75_24360 [Paenibacillus sp. 7541]